MRRMLIPPTHIKSKIVDDEWLLDLYVLEPYLENGIVIFQTIMSNLPNNTNNGTINALELSDDHEGISYYIKNGSIITLKINDDGIRVYGDFYDNNDDGTPFNFLYFEDQPLNRLSIRSSLSTSFDLYVIKN